MLLLPGLAGASRSHWVPPRGITLVAAKARLSVPSQRDGLAGLSNRWPPLMLRRLVGLCQPRNFSLGPIPMGRLLNGDLDHSKRWQSSPLFDGWFLIPSTIQPGSGPIFPLL
jgi:hypothetical protein